MADLFVGPGTAKFYKPNELAALQRQAGGPLLVITADDAKYLSNPSDEHKSIKEIRSWFPPNTRLDYERMYSAIYQHMIQSGSPTTFPLYDNKDRANTKIIGGVIFVPGSSFNPNYFRQQTGINFGDGKISPELLREAGLFIAAHEATHVNLFIQDKNSEVRAEMGGYKFLADNPKLFPQLRHPEKAQAFLAGRRALFTFVSGGGDAGHRWIPFMDPKSWSDDRATEALVKSHGALNNVTDKVAQEMLKKGTLPPIPENKSFYAATRSVQDPWLYVKNPEEREALQNKINYDNDSTGLLRHYVGARGIRNLQGEQARAALQEFHDKVAPLFDNSKYSATNPNKKRLEEAKIAGFAFLREHKITPAQLTTFVKQGETKAAPEHLEDSLRAAKDVLICKNGSSTCDYPDKIIDLANPLLKDSIQTVRDLNARGKFKDSPMQQLFIDNLIKGADFYMEQSALKHGNTIKRNLFDPAKASNKI